MNKITQHIPGFCDGFEARVSEFSELVELIAVPWVAHWEKSPGGFHRWSVSRAGESTCLMAEYDGGKKWWVVGYLAEPVDGLPEWRPIRVSAPPAPPAGT